METQIYEVRRMDLDKLLGLGGWAAAVIGSILALVKAVRFWNSEADKEEADVSERYQNVAAKAGDYARQLLDRVDRLEAEITRLREDIIAQEEYILDTKSGIQKLVKQIVEAGLDPIWTPSDWTRPSRRPDGK
jgi:uncharacterized protein (UPF0335 family)